MKKIYFFLKNFIFLGFFFLILRSGYADAILIHAQNYQDLETQLEKSTSDFSHTLLVLDDDNTLTTLPCKDPQDLETCQYLGGTAWGIWQSKLDKNSPMRLSPEDEKIYEANGVIFSLSHAVLTEPDVPLVLEKLTQKGAKLLIETARDSNMLNATESQLSNLNALPGSSLLDFINRHAPQSPHNGANLPGEYYPCGDLSHRHVRYENGVYYLAGQNKGVMLKCLFQDLGLSAISPAFTQIIFMDDTPKNAEDVYDTFKDLPAYHLTAVIYHGMDAHRDAFLTGPMAEKYQMQAEKSWERLRQAIHASIPNPTI